MAAFDSTQVLDPSASSKDTYDDNRIGPVLKLVVDLINDADIIGPAGVAGPAGPSTTTGTTGPTGAGFVGPSQGPTGPTGRVGEVGPVGPTGATGPAGSSRSYSIAMDAITASPSSFSTIAYFPWRNATFSTYTTVYLIAYVLVSGPNMIIQILNATNIVPIGTTTTAGTGIYTVPIPLINKPVADTYLQIQIEATASGTAPQLLGLVINFDP